MREAQIDCQRQDVHAEWRTRLQALRGRCQSHSAATQAAPNISLHPRHHRTDWRQINLVVKIVQHLLGIGQRGLAVHAGQRLGYDRRIGIAGQRPATTLPADATLPRAIPPRLLRLVGLLSLRRPYGFRLHANQCVVPKPVPHICLFTANGSLRTRGVLAPSLRSACARQPSQTRRARLPCQKGDAACTGAIAPAPRPAKTEHGSYSAETLRGHAREWGLQDDARWVPD